MFIVSVKIVTVGSLLIAMVAPDLVNRLDSEVGPLSSFFITCNAYLASLI